VPAAVGGAGVSQTDPFTQLAKGHFAAWEQPQLFQRGARGLPIAAQRQYQRNCGLVRKSDKLVRSQWTPHFSSFSYTPRFGDQALVGWRNIALKRSTMPIRFTFPWTGGNPTYRVTSEFAVTHPDIGPLLVREGAIFLFRDITAGLYAFGSLGVNTIRKQGDFMGRVRVTFLWRGL